MAKVEFSGAIVFRLGGLREVRVDGRTLGAVMENLENLFPSLKGLLISGGKLSSLYFIYVNGKDVRKGGDLLLPVDDDSVIRIMNALTGG